MTGPPPLPPYLMVTARFLDGRCLIARLDPRTPERHSPLKRALRAAHIPLANRDGP